MSRTYKRYTGHCFRRPRGHKQALIAGVPNRAVPPDSWDDIPFDKQVYLPMKVADKMAKQGYSYHEIVRHIMYKYKVRLGDAEWMSEDAVWMERRRIPEGLLAVYGEKNI